MPTENTSSKRMNKSPTIEQTLNTFLVGGAVRDSQLNRPVIEKDYLVVGATSEQMLELGFVPVGKDFPVFLHPETKEEYALARTEKKQGKGYQGFVCYASPEVTLEEDLKRRDLTVNAMAMDKAGKIHDPYQGLVDLESKILRHVSPAFSEDPLRVLRVARFAARYRHLGFNVADETMALMANISDSGELEYLSAERVWKEVSRAISEADPSVFFHVLYDCGALTNILPSIAVRWRDISETFEYQCQFSSDANVRFALLTLLTEQSAKQLKQVSEDLKLPNHAKSIALDAEKNKAEIINVSDATSINALFNRLDGWRKPEHAFEVITAVLISSLTTEQSFEQHLKPQIDLLKNSYQQATKVIAKPFVEQGLKGKEIKEAIEAQRIQIIEGVLSAN